MIGDDLRLVSGRWDERDELRCSTCGHDRMQLCLDGSGLLVLCGHCQDTVATDAKATP